MMPFGTRASRNSSVSKRRGGEANREKESRPFTGLSHLYRLLVTTSGVVSTRHPSQTLQTGIKVSAALSPALEPP